MRNINLNRGWGFGPGLADTFKRLTGRGEGRVVDLPHDYMIESDVYAAAPAGSASGYYNAGVAHYVKAVDIPAEWAGERVALRMDGANLCAGFAQPRNVFFGFSLADTGFCQFNAAILKMLVPNSHANHGKPSFYQLL